MSTEVRQWPTTLGRWTTLRSHAHFALTEWVFAHRPARERSSMRRSACAILIATGILLVASGALAAEGQLVLVPDPRLLIGLLLLFAFLIPPVQAALFTPLLRVLEERTERIDGTRRRASRLVEESAEILSRYETSIRAAREEADAERKEQLRAARSEGAQETSQARSAAEAEIESARREVADALVAARGSLRSQAEDLANQAAERVLGRPLS
ncbi:MAG: ATP synthase F0 subunit B [Myxococcales bacterium]|nr:ATP synthase F0 subunit B [Myxococcales bacterium]